MQSFPRSPNRTYRYHRIQECRPEQSPHSIRVLLSLWRGRLVSQIQERHQTNSFSLSICLQTIRIIIQFMRSRVRARLTLLFPLAVGPIMLSFISSRVYDHVDNWNSHNDFVVVTDIVRRADGGQLSTKVQFMRSRIGAMLTLLFPLVVGPIIIVGDMSIASTALFLPFARYESLVLRACIVGEMSTGFDLSKMSQDFDFFISMSTGFNFSELSMALCDLYTSRSSRYERLLPGACIVGKMSIVCGMVIDIGEETIVLRQSFILGGILGRNRLRRILSAESSSITC